MFGPFVEHGIPMEEVRRMDLHDVALMHGYWRRNPPLRVLIMAIAASMGVNLEPLTKPKINYDLTPGPQHMTPEAFKRLVDMTGGKIEGVGQFGG